VGLDGPWPTQRDPVVRRVRSDENLIAHASLRPIARRPRPPFLRPSWALFFRGTPRTGID
ncbi:hypothetical protein, partial [Burkholderia sp. SIMBA_062]|uniref:hypothetical protein n=1 Tax=Burkholderia sp. SIMBA_062 TaxID=3085803 RepID=UPI00397C6ED2